MNKKFLICGAIATSLFLSACVKKEAPQEEEQVEVEVQQTEQITEQAQFEPLEAETPEVSETEAPVEYEVERTETENTTTEIRREVTPREPAPAPQPAQAAPAEDKPVEARPANPDSQSQDDAVAAAIAAATPALEN
ncbi:internalin [Acinetobacter indicus]|uniref:internalin n=1 Tax=Acinetobacter indicus TaxID=756892 RepID=UPI000CEC854D|nr:internalin [Acinetobacter indicus]